jgi:hypothetical protein
MTAGFLIWIGLILAVVFSAALIVRGARQLLRGLDAGAWLIFGGLAVLMLIFASVDTWSAMVGFGGS